MRLVSDMYMACPNEATEEDAVASAFPSNVTTESQLFATPIPSQRSACALIRHQFFLSLVQILNYADDDGNNDR